MAGWQSWAAGILPVAMHGGTPMVLLGKDARSKGGQWSDFVGGGEECDFSPRHTALRELEEETGGALTLCLRDVDGALEFSGTTPSGKVLHRYIVRVPYDQYLPLRFSGSKDGEKQGIAWFALDALPPMRRVFAAQMQHDREAIARFCRASREFSSV